MERTDFFVERIDYIVERSDYWLERPDLERSDHGTKWPDTTLFMHFVNTLKDVT